MGTSNLNNPKRRKLSPSEKKRTSDSDSTSKITEHEKNVHLCAH